MTNRVRLLALFGVVIALAATTTGCATAGPTPQERLAAIYPADRPFPESRFSTFGGVTLHYRSWIPGIAPTAKLLLLHTEGGSTVTYRLLGPLLAERGIAVLAVDLPGFGWSDPALEFDHALPNRANLIWTLVDRLDTETNSFAPSQGWIVGGHGMGGQVAAQMALDRPARTRGLLLFATRLAEPHDVLPVSWFPPVRWALRSWVENSLYTPEGVLELLSAAYGREAAPEEVDLYTAPLVREDMARAYVRYAHTAGTIDLPIESIESPIAIIWGQADETIARERADALQSRLPRAEFTEIEGTAHLPMETDTSSVASALISWIDSLD